MNLSGEVLTMIGAFITGILSLIGVIITNHSSNNKFINQLEKSQAITDTKLENLTEEVKKHNNFATRVPVIENRLDTLENTVKEIKDEITK